MVARIKQFDLSFRTFFSVIFGVMATAVPSQGMDWPLPTKGRVCRDSFAVSSNGQWVVYLEEHDQQPPPRRGPPFPANATIWAYNLGDQTAIQLGQRLPGKGAFLYFCYPDRSGDFFAAVVHRLTDPSFPSSHNEPAVYIVDLAKESSHLIAEDILRVVWSVDQGTLVVSSAEQEQVKQRVRSYDPRTQKWSQLPIFGICWAMSENGRKGLFSVAPDSIGQTEQVAINQDVLAVMTSEGNLIRSLAFIEEYMNPPVVSGDFRFMAVKRQVGFSGSVAIVDLDGDSDFLVEFRGEYELVGITNGGQAVVMVPGPSFESPRTLRLLSRNGSMSELATNVEVAAVVGEKVYYISGFSPNSLHRIQVRADGF